MHFLDLPPKFILEVFEKLSPQDLDNLRRTCQIIGEFIEDNRNFLQSRKLLHLDLDDRRIRAWHDVSWCDRIPRQSFDYLSKFFKNVEALVLTVNKLDEETSEFLIRHARKNNFRFEQLRLFHSFTASHETIARLLQFAHCRTVNFEAVQSNLKAEHLSFPGYKNLRSICFEMDDSLEPEDFQRIFELENCVNFIFHGCDNIDQTFVQTIFEKFSKSLKRIEAIRITANKNINFDTILANNPNLSMVQNAVWKLENPSYEKAIITVRRNAFHFFMAFEVNDKRIEDILYKIPIIE